MSLTIMIEIRIKSTDVTMLRRRARANLPVVTRFFAMAAPYAARAQCARCPAFRQGRANRDNHPRGAIEAACLQFKAEQALAFE